MTEHSVHSAHGDQPSSLSVASQEGTHTHEVVPSLSNASGRSGTTTVWGLLWRFLSREVLGRRNFLWAEAHHLGKRLGDFNGKSKAQGREH